MTAEKKSIVVVGSMNIDLVVSAERVPRGGETVAGTDFQIHPGGKGANQAVAVARLGYPVKMIGKVGDDAFGQQLLQSLRAVGVDTGAVATIAGTTGTASIAVASDGENSIIVVPGANAHVSPAFLDSHEVLIRQAGLVLTQLEIPIESVAHLAEMCRRVGVPLMLDPAPAQRLPDRLLRKLTWFTPNETEAAFFTEEHNRSGPEELARTFLDEGTQGVILKMGSNGSYLATREEQTRVAPFRVRAVDSTAAGDAFNGAFAAALLSGKSAKESARFASAAAAISVTRIGAQPSMPTLGEVEELLATTTQD